MAVIRVATAADLGPIAELHQRAFRGFFLTQLGRPFLLRYYRAVLAYPGGILLLAEEALSIVGFVAGFCEPGLFYRSLRRRALSLGLSMAPALLRNPRLLHRAVANFRRTSEAERHDHTHFAELSSLAVDPAAEGRGIGRGLVTDFTRVAAEKGAFSVCLTTDALENDAVNCFYRRLGFEVRRTFESTPGRWLNEFRLQVRSSRTECARTS
jgi:ribosomal protein S18 acetylase RimI-like enzyme